MEQKRTDPSPSVVQLLRHALNSNLAATFAPDGQVRIHEGVLSGFSVAEHRSRTEGFDEDAAIELGPLQPIAYCADWKDAAQYPNPGERSGRRWAWEFLRRNEQYALLAIWMNGLPEAIRLQEEPRPDDLLEHMLCEPAPIGGARTVADYRRHCRTKGIPAIVVTPLRVLQYCWNVSIPLLPCTEFSDLSSEQQQRFFSHDDPTVLTQDFLVKNFYPPEFPFQKVRATISSNEALLKIDFNQDIRMQLEEVKEKLEIHQRSYLIAARQAVICSDDSRVEDANESLDAVPGMDNYIYSLQFQLRIFDAKTLNDGVCGKPLLKTIEVLFDSESGDGNVNVSGNPKAITMARLREWLTTACKRVEGKGYIELARFDPSSKDKRKEVRIKNKRNEKKINVPQIKAAILSNAKDAQSFRSPSLESIWHDFHSEENK